MRVNKSKKNYIVIQLGSRMNYAVPTFLAQEKSLVSFAVDR